MDATVRTGIVLILAINVSKCSTTSLIPRTLISPEKRFRPLQSCGAPGQKPRGILLIT